jgi:hypothetical protein
MSRTDIEKLKDTVSEYLHTRFGRWYYDIIYDTDKVEIRIISTVKHNWKRKFFGAEKLS